MLIDGVAVKDLKVNADERGRLFEILRCDDFAYTLTQKFGQVYLTTAYPGVVKGWHYHKEQCDNMCVISGMAKVVLWDGRGSKSPTDNLINEFVVGEHNLKLIHIPSFVYHGIKCISEKECLVLNIINNPYDHSGPDEFRANPHDSIVPYKWERKDG